MKSDVTGADGGFRCVNDWISGGNNQVNLNAIIEQPCAIEGRIGPLDRTEPEYMTIGRLARFQIMCDAGDVIK